MFTPAPFVSFRSGYSLRSHLVRAKVYPLIREKGSACCGKSRCETCFNIQDTDNFQSFVAKEVYKIFIGIVNVLFTLFLAKYVAYNMLGQQLTDSV